MSEALLKLELVLTNGLGVVNVVTPNNAELCGVQSKIGIMLAIHPLPCVYYLQITLGARLSNCDKNVPVCMPLRDSVL